MQLENLVFKEFCSQQEKIAKYPSSDSSHPTENSNLPTVSIIILNFNGKPFLGQCLSSVLKINYPTHLYEVLLVDNGSKDGSQQYVKENFSSVRFLSLDKNYGFSGGNNKGAQVAKGDVLVFLNNDVKVDRDWLLELVKVACSEDKIGICGSKVLYMDAPSIIQFAGGYLHTLGGSVSINYRKENNLFQAVSSSGYVVGCSLLIKKSVFDLLEGFDEDYYMYGEESDLCWRAWIYGYSVMYNPDSIVYHVGGASRKDKLFTGKDFELKRGYLDARAVSETSLFHGNKNAIFTMLKNLEAKDLFKAFLFSFVLMFVQSVNLMIDGKTKWVLLVIRSYLWPIRNFSLIYRKRLRVQKERKISDATLFDKNVIIPMNRLINLAIQSMNLSK